MQPVTPTRRRVAVLGGGITGLAAAYTLAQARRSGAPIEEFLVEASDRLGGVIRTEHLEGFVVEGGPDSFLAEKPEAAALCRELGLGESLIGSNDETRRTSILHQGRLVALPEGLQLLVPTRYWPVLTTPLIPLGSKLAILTEWLRSYLTNSDAALKKHPADESVGDFVRRHFGKGVLENIADPLLAGIYGGDSSRLSVRSTLPRFCEMELNYGSLIRAARELNRKRSAPAPARGSTPSTLFVTLKNGLEQLVEALRNNLQDSRLLLRQPVVALECQNGGGTRAGGPPGPKYKVRCQDGLALDADAVILALPPGQCARLLGPWDPRLSEALNAIPSALAVTVALAYEAGALGELPGGFGFLVPKKEERRILACTFVHHKFAHRAPPGGALLRCFLGGVNHYEIANMSDDSIVSVVRKELGAILGLRSTPAFHRVYRWPGAMPQYVVGHEDRLETIQARLADAPGLFLAGNAYAGIGISDCIRSGRATAEAILRSVPR